MFCDSFVINMEIPVQPVLMANRVKIPKRPALPEHPPALQPLPDTRAPTLQSEKAVEPSYDRYQFEEPQPTTYASTNYTTYEAAAPINLVTIGDCDQLLMEPSDEWRRTGNRVMYRYFSNVIDGKRRRLEAGRCSWPAIGNHVHACLGELKSALDAGAVEYQTATSERRLLQAQIMTTSLLDLVDCATGD